MSKKIFLATTAYEEFWDKNSENGLFLGEWCKLYNKRDSYKSICWNTLENIWRDEKEIDNGIIYCETIYQNILRKLHNSLNNYHDLNKDLRYWDIILKSWLLPYIQIIYDKYRHIKLAQEKYVNIYTYSLDEGSYSFINIPSTFLQKIVTSDEYNLQLYSQIIKFLKIESRAINLETKEHDLKIEFKSSKKEKLLRFISNILNKVFNKDSILIVNPYFKHNMLKKLILLSLKSNFLFIFDNLAYDIKVDTNVNLSKRTELFRNNSIDEFENLLCETLIYNFPIIYLEGFLDFRREVLKLPIKETKIIYSANAIYGNEIFKFYVAENYKKLLITYGQHGGNIGIDKVNIPEEIEKSFCDIYFTYGWSDKKTKVLPGELEIINSFDNEKIIYIMTALPRYFYRFVYQEDSAKTLDYIESTKEFLKSFNLINKLTIRPYMQDYQWSIKERLLEINNDLKFDNHTNYYKQIQDAKIVIFDHMHTGYLETLSMNIPTVIIIPQNIYYFRENAKPYIQLLKDVNILFENPIEASRFIEFIYADIDSWWQSDEVQKVREEFCFQYARTSKNWVNEWVKEFDSILEENARK